MKERQDLLRIVKNKDGAIYFDGTKKGQGRGAYICNNPECFKKVKKTKGLDRAFKTSIPENVYEALEKEMDDE